MINYLSLLLLVTAVAGQGRFADSPASERRFRARPQPRTQDLYFEDTRGIQNQQEPRYISDAGPPPQTLDKPQRRPQAERQRIKEPPVAILRQISEKKDDGSYVYGYEGADGSFKIETRYPDGLVKGKYGYVDTDGKVRVIEYGADRLGFQPSGEGITVPPITIPKETDPFLDYDYPLEEDPAPEPPRRAPEPPRSRPAQRRPSQRRRQRPQPSRIQSRPQRPEPQPQYTRQRPEPNRGQTVPQPISVQSIVGGLPPPKQSSPPVYQPEPQYQPQPQSPSRQQEFAENEIPQEKPPPPKPFSFTHEVNYGAPQQQNFGKSFPAPARPAPRPVQRRPASRPAQRRPAPRPAQTLPDPRPAPQAQQRNPSILDSLLSQFQLPRQAGSKNIHDITFGVI